MSNIQAAMALLIGSFTEYASKEGDKNTLNKGELKELLQNEFGDKLGKANDKAAVEEIFNRLDMDRSNSVDFTEFVTMVAALTAATHEMLTRQ